MVNRRIQHGGESPFKIGRPCKGECRGAGTCRIFASPRKIEQLICIVGRFDSRVQNEIVAGAFTLLTEASCCDPSDRMKPIEAPRYLGTDLQEPIPAGNMRKFMGEYDSPALLRPLSSHCGK